MALPNTPALQDTFTEQVRSRLLGQKSLESRRFYYRGSVSASATVELFVDGITNKRLGLPEDSCVMVNVQYALFTDAATPLSKAGGKVFLFRRNGSGDTTQVATADTDNVLYDYVDLADSGSAGEITEASAQGVVDLAADTVNQAIILNLTGTTTTPVYCEAIVEIKAFASPKQTTVAYIT